jgi:succinate-semialdehyde dehydrogenase/glutarate-semialdehyde dehydrogenase
MQPHAELPDTIEAIDPATRASLGHVTATPAAALAARIAGARAAQRAWQELAAAQRAQSLSVLRDLVRQRALAIGQTIGRGMGRPLIEALSLEVAVVLAALDRAITLAAAGLAEPVAPETAGHAQAERIRAAPRGVAAVIAPASAPFALAMVPAVAALAAGNAVIVKPSSVAPLVGTLIESLFEAAFAALPGLAQVVHGNGALGARLAVENGIDFIVFSGTAATGRTLQAALAPLHRPAILALGRSDALIVCEDASLERAANAAVFGRFCNCGQGQDTIARVYVHAAVADAFIDKLVRKVRSLKNGPWNDPFCAVGPLASGRHLQHLRALMQDAIDRGASLVSGAFPRHVMGRDGGERHGAQSEGWYWRPSVLARVTQSMRVMREEIHGPIMAVQVINDDAEAITRANDTPLRMNACVFSRDPAHARKVATQLHAGTVAINDVLAGRAEVGEIDRADASVAVGPTLIETSEAEADSDPGWFPYTATRLAAVEKTMGIHSPASLGDPPDPAGRLPILGGPG